MKIKAKLIKGFQVASGTSPNNPYNDSTIKLQKTHFKNLGLNLEDCYNGTLNLAFDAFSILPSLCPIIIKYNP